MKEYTYDGPVYVHGNCYYRRWTVSTTAPSEKKARSNLIYRFKKENNVFMGTQVDLPGKFIERVI